MARWWIQFFLADDFPYLPVINYGALVLKDSPGDPEDFWLASYDLCQEDLEIDGIYDVRELGKTSGNVALDTVSTTLTAEYASEILLEIKRIFDQETIPFYTISLSIQESENLEENPDIERFEVREFLYADIYEKELVERIEDSVQELEAYINEKER